jgi:hypothetical protein
VVAGVAARRWAVMAEPGFEAVVAHSLAEPVAARPAGVPVHPCGCASRPDAVMAAVASQTAARDVGGRGLPRRGVALCAAGVGAFGAVGAVGAWRLAAWVRLAWVRLAAPLLAWAGR